jgi:hypothetical protein
MKRLLTTGILFACLLGMNPSALAVTDYTKILGDWKSAFGVVHIETMSKDPEMGAATLQGYWDQPNAGRGVIEAGNYNARLGRLVLSYYQPWNKQRGQATFTLDESKMEFNGTWRNSDDRTGPWKLYK